MVVVAEGSIGNGIAAAAAAAAVIVIVGVAIEGAFVRRWSIVSNLRLIVLPLIVVWTYCLSCVMECEYVIIGVCVCV